MSFSVPQKANASGERLNPSNGGRSANSDKERLTSSDMTIYDMYFNVSWLAIFYISDLPEKLISLKSTHPCSFFRRSYIRIRIKLQTFFKAEVLGQRSFLVKISKWEFCKSDCRFIIHAKNCEKKVLFFFYSSWSLGWFYCRLVEFLILKKNKAGYTATPVACGWAGAELEKVTRAFGQEQ